MFGKLCFLRYSLNSYRNLVQFSNVAVEDFVERIYELKES